MTDLTFEHYDSPGAKALAAEIILPLHLAANAHLLDDPFYSAERFTERFNNYITSPGFGLVLARDRNGNRTAVGQAFGYALPPKARWWNGLVDEVPEGFIEEDGARTFAINEIMVRPDRRRQGIARALHDALLARRPERRATLLVEAENTPAVTAYHHWGWRSAARLQPFPDAPTYNALVIDLPLS